MLGAAFAAAAASAATGSAWIGLAAGVGTSSALALVLAFACVTYRGDQVVAAMALNIVVAGLAPTLALAWFDMGGQTPQLEGNGQRFVSLVWPWAGRARRGAVPGAPVFRAPERPQHRRLPRARARAPRRLGPRPHPFRAPAPGRRRKPDRGRHRRDIGRPAALPGGPGLGRPLRGRGNLPVDGGELRIRPRHDRRQGLPRPGGADLRQVAALADVGGLPALRLHRRRWPPGCRESRCRASASSRSSSSSPSRTP